MQVCSANKGKPERVIADESSTEESKSESVHKSIYEEKYAIDETDHEEPLLKYNPVVKEPIYFNPFERNKNILNMLDARCKQAYMETSRNKYYTEMLNNLTD